MSMCSNIYIYIYIDSLFRTHLQAPPRTPFTNTLTNTAAVAAGHGPCRCGFFLHPRDRKGVRKGVRRGCRRDVRNIYIAKN